MEIKRVFDLLDNYVEKYPNQQVALAGKKNGQWAFLWDERTSLVSFEGDACSPVASALTPGQCGDG